MPLPFPFPLPFVVGEGRVNGFAAAGLAGAGLADVVTALLPAAAAVAAGWELSDAAEARRMARLPLRRRGLMAEDSMRVMMFPAWIDVLTVSCGGGGGDKLIAPGCMFFVGVCAVLQCEGSKIRP